jgi:aquaporin Z
VFSAHQLLGEHLSAPPVCYVITIPGERGNVIAFAAEFFLSGFLMAVVLFATNHRRLARLSPIIVACVTVFYYGLCSSLSGFSVNPARSFSSAIFAQIWHSIWVYFAAPCFGNAGAASTYLRSEGRQNVYCAKIYHDLQSTCPFRCNFDYLYREPERVGNDARVAGAKTEGNQQRMESACRDSYQ